MNDNINVEVIKAGKTGLFCNYIFKAIPLAFDESMSYYECLCGLLNYLKNTIIPTVNNNAEAVAELQNLFTKLQEYVNNYFDNLDVQDEINNKLDQMVEDGTLKNILLNYTSTFKVYNTTIDMINDYNNLTNNMNIITLGYFNMFDGGSCMFKIENENNDELSIKLENNLYAKYVINNEINTLQYGIKNDGLTDVSTKLETLINYCIKNNINIVFNAGTYYIANKIINNDYENQNFNLTIDFNNANIIVDNINESFLELHYLNNLSIKNLVISSNFESNSGYSNVVALHLYWINKIDINNIKLNNMNSLIQTDYIEDLNTNFLNNTLTINNIECIDCPLLGYFNNLNNSYINDIVMKKGDKNINVREVFYIRTNVVNFYANNLNINNVERYLLHCNRKQTDGNYSPAIGIKPSNNINITNVNISFDDNSNYTYLLHFDSDDESVYAHNIKITNTDGLVGVTDKAKIKNIRLNKIYLTGSKNIKALYDLNNNTYNINNLICDDISINQKIDNNSITGLINNFEIKNNKYNNTYNINNKAALFLFVNNTNSLLIDNLIFNDNNVNTLNQFIQISNSSCEAVVRNMRINASNININYVLIGSGTGNSKLILYDNLINTKTAKKIVNNQEGNVAIEYNNYINYQT